MSSLKLSDGSTVSADLKKQARGVKIAQMLWENPANELQNFRNFGAPCAEKVRALGERALRKPLNVAAAIGEVGSAVASE